MPFWKKSEDPWDVTPAKERAKREPIENPLDTLRDWNEERKARAAAKQAELEAQPKEVCPWCGREMERGYFPGGRDGVLLRLQSPVRLLPECPHFPRGRGEARDGFPPAGDLP